MCGGDDLTDALRSDLAVVNRDGEALVFHSYSRNLRQAVAQLGGRALEERHEGGGRFILVIGAVRSRQLKPVAAGVPEPGYVYAGADIRKVATAQDRHGTYRRHEFQRLGRPIDKRGRARIGNDGGQRSVIVEKQHRLSGAGDADQLTIGLQRIRDFRDALVTRANRDVGLVGDHDVGTVARQVVGASGPADADDERESAVAARGTA